MRRIEVHRLRTGCLAIHLLPALLLVCTGPLAARDQGDRLRLVHADLLQQKVAGELTAVGNVQLQQGKTTIKCDVATVHDDVYTLAGSVHIYERERSLTADTVYVYESDKQQVAIGNVRSIREHQVTRADRMTYSDRQNMVLSEGNVVVEDTEDRSFVTGGRGEYWRDQDIGQITVEPVYTQYDSLGEALTTITSDTMEIYQTRDLMTARRNVVLTQKATVATCALAEYYKGDNQIHLTGNPEVKKRNQTIAGDTLNLYIKESEIARVEISGNAVAIECLE